MKSLLVVRHAKSSWETTTVEDIDRPLNDRGKKDAPDMARRLLKKEVMIDAFLSSPAKRAKKTAILFMEQFGKSKDELFIIPELYNAPAAVFTQVITAIDDDYNTIAIFAHNPGVTDFVNSLTDLRVDNMPTCAVFAVHVPVQSWSAFETASKKLWFFDYPKIKS